MSRLSNLYIGITTDKPQPTDGEVQEFLLYEPENLRAEVLAHEDDFVPPFLVELDKALVGYRVLIADQHVR